MEYREGRGMVLFCQTDVSGRTESDPAAEALAGNILRYVAGWQPAPRRSVVYAGEPAGKQYLQSAGFAAADYQAGSLSPEQVLVVGPGGARALSAEAVGGFLASGRPGAGDRPGRGGSELAAAGEGQDERGGAHCGVFQAAGRGLGAGGRVSGGGA